MRELRERVAEETGVVLGEDWTAKVELKTSNGKKGSSAKRRTRFFSPGGRRFSSASEVVGYVQDTLAKKRVGQGLAPGVGPTPRSVERTRRNNADYADDDVDAPADPTTLTGEETMWAAFVRTSFADRSLSVVCLAGFCAKFETGLAWGLMATWARDVMGLGGRERGERRDEGRRRRRRVDRKPRQPGRCRQGASNPPNHLDRILRAKTGTPDPI